MNFVVNVEHCQRTEHAIIIVVLTANATDYDVLLHQWWCDLWPCWSALEYQKREALAPLGHGLGAI
jgi:hypothetical protein